MGDRIKLSGPKNTKFKCVICGIREDDLGLVIKNGLCRPEKYLMRVKYDLVIVCFFRTETWMNYE